MSRENYKNFIIKGLLDNVGRMEYSDVIRKFKEKFLTGYETIYVHADELIGKEYEDFWYNAIGWGRTERRVYQFLRSRKTIGLWDLTPEGMKTAQKLPQEEGLLYGEHPVLGIAKALSGTTDPN